MAAKDKSLEEVSLRDAIAIAAMVGILAGGKLVTHTRAAKTGVAEDAYDIADAMLEKRKEVP